MTRWLTLLLTVPVCTSILCGCSSSGGNPVTLTADPATAVSSDTRQARTHLWGYYDAYIDFERETAGAVPNRDAMFAMNVVPFLNYKPAGLEFDIISTPIGPDYVDVLVDVSISHPYPGLPKFNGYDVMGIFIGDGSSAFDYGSGIRYATLGVDQFVFNSDGYTRWFNPTNFPVPGVMGYTPGNRATPDYIANGTCNPYKYFADGLGAVSNVFSFLNTTTDSGVFSSGAVNTRRYEVRFPNIKGGRFNYAIVANWQGVDPADHPSNAPEAVGVDVTLTDNIYYVDETNNGGYLILDIRVFNWGKQPDTIFVESPVLMSAYQLTPEEMTPTGGLGHVSNYHVEIPAKYVTHSGTSEFWVITQYSEFDYTSEYTPPAGAPNASLAAFFRSELYILPNPYTHDPVCDVKLVGPSMPYDDWETLVEFDASGTTDPDPYDVVSFEWDFNGDGVFGDPFDEGTDANPKKFYSFDLTGDVCVRASDGIGGESECCVAVDITTHPQKNIDITNGSSPATDIAMDPNNGDVLAFYPSVGQVRRYTRSTFYGEFSTYTVILHPNTEWIDVNSAGYFELAYYSGDVLSMFFFNPSGSLIYYHEDSLDPIAGIMDITGFPDTGSYPGALGAFMYRDDGDYGFTSGHVRYSTTSPGMQFDEVFSASGGGSSITDINALNVRGGEVNAAGDAWWWVEAEGCVCKMFSIPNLSSSTAFFGQWMTPGDADNLLNQPHDVTRDNEDTFYILDELSTGDYVIKGFTFDGAATAAIESFGGSDDWAYTPVRIEGSDFNGSLVVLQNDGTDSYLSVLPESEIPD